MKPAPMAATLLAVMLGAALAAYSQQPPDVCVSVAPLSQPDSPVRIMRIEYGDRENLRLQLENTTDAAVVAVYIQYDLFAPAECTAEKKRDAAVQTASGDAQRLPGMNSVDIPGHSQVWYTHHMTSALPHTAIRDLKSRYVRVVAKITHVAFANGAKTDWRKWVARGAPQRNDGDKDLCAKWAWDESLGDVRNGWWRTPPREPRPTASQRTHTTVGEGLTYTCVVNDGSLLCPE